MTQDEAPTAQPQIPTLTQSAPTPSLRKVTGSTTLGELRDVLRELGVGLELVRHRRPDGARHVFSARLVTARGVHPEREGEGSSDTPWDAISQAFSAMRRQ